MQSEFNKLCSLYADREYAGKTISLNNVSNSKIRNLEIVGETKEFGEGDKSPDNPYELVESKPTVKIIRKNILNPDNKFINGYLNNFNADAESGSGQTMYRTFWINMPFKTGDKITISSNNDFYVVRFIDDNNNSYSANYTLPHTWIITDACDSIQISLRTGTADSEFTYESLSDCQIQAEYGVSATDFKPYDEQSVKIISKNLYSPVKDNFLQFNKKLSLSENNYITLADAKNESENNLYMSYTYNRIDLFSENTKYTFILEVAEAEYTGNFELYISAKGLEGDIFHEYSFVKNPVIGIYKFANETVSNFDNEIYALRGVFILYPGAEVSKLKFRISVIQTDDVDLDNFEYTPYKDNYVLNSVGDVTDTYNPLTGEYVQRVGKLVLDGDEMWNRTHVLGDTSHLYIQDIQDIVKKPVSTQDYPNIVCSHYPTTNYYSILYREAEGVSINTAGFCSFRVPYLSRSTFNEFLQEQYANGTPVTVYYELAEPVTTIINKVPVLANIPDTTMYIEDNNNLGSIRTVLQTKGR